MTTGEVYVIRYDVYDIGPAYVRVSCNHPPILRILGIYKDR